MVNPSKWANLKSNFLKFHHRNQVISGIEKARKIAYFRAFLAFLSCRLSLAELRSATSGFEAVLLLLAKDLEEAYGFPVLVVRPKGASLTLAAQLQGLKAFRTPHHIAGVLLNDCTEMLYKLLAPMLEREIGLPVVGFLPPMPDAAIESRHLGLKTAGEIKTILEKPVSALSAHV